MVTQCNKCVTSFSFKDTGVLQMSSWWLCELSAAGLAPVWMHPAASAAARCVEATQGCVAIIFALLQLNL